MTGSEISMLSGMGKVLCRPLRSTNAGDEDGSHLRRTTLGTRRSRHTLPRRSCTSVSQWKMAPAGKG
jgi:hypothetical protein